MTIKLWGKLEVDEEEQALIDRYKFNEAILIDVDQPNLFRKAAGAGFIAGLVALG